MGVRIRRLTLDSVAYQTVAIPNGAAPLTVTQDLTGGGYSVFYIDPAEHKGSTQIGVYRVWSEEELPDGVLLLPEVHPLINQVLPPNARYVGTVGNAHFIFGNPRLPKIDPVPPPGQL